MPSSESSSIIALDRFIQATRDSGYRNTSSALAELVDNSLQANAKRVSITIAPVEMPSSDGVQVAVLDNGCGMDRSTLRQALRFGGSTRFNDRTGLGRYGMGLPNSSLSQAKRLEVYAWQSAGSFLFSYLDVDEIAAGDLVDVPAPRRMKPPTWPGPCESRSGTLVVWQQCDRLDHRRISTLARKVIPMLGRMFRYSIWNGVQLTVNGEAVKAIDPLYLHPNGKITGAQPFDRPMEFEIRVPAINGEGEKSGRVIVSFAELPVHEWHSLSNDEKRARGVANGAGVSVVRCGREIDYGWFFMPGKRRENYDDWWRCEVKFDSCLDEAFGITHTKQQIRPRDYLLESISPHIEVVAKTLNARVREAHTTIKVSARVADSEQLAGRLDAKLKPLPHVRLNGSHESVVRVLERKYPSLKEPAAERKAGGVDYRIVYDKIKDTSFFSPVVENGRLILVVNPDHPFYKTVYKPLVDEQSLRPADVRRMIDLLLLTAARAEAMATRRPDREAISAYRSEWSRALAVFLNG